MSAMNKREATVGGQDVAPAGRKASPAAALHVEARADQMLIVLPRLISEGDPARIIAGLYALRSAPATARRWVVDCSALAYVPYPVLDALLCFGSDLFMDGRRLEIRGLTGSMIPAFYAESLKLYLCI